MAAVDKIYATKEKRQEFYVWLVTHKPSLLRYLYEWYTEWDEDPKVNRPISNFPEWADNWLMKHCPIKWVVDAIKDQYGLIDENTKSETI